MTNVFGSEDRSLTGMFKRGMGSLVYAVIDAITSVALCLPAGRAADAAYRLVVDRILAWHPDSGEVTETVTPGVTLRLYRHNGGTPLAEVAGASKLLTALLLKHYSGFRAGGVATLGRDGKVNIHISVD